MFKKRVRHTEKFKRDAVRLVLSRGDCTTGDIAQSIGVSEGILKRWRERYDDVVRASLSTDETPEQEIKRLRRENERLRQERAILMKVAACLAKESA